MSGDPAQRLLDGVAARERLARAARAAALCLSILLALALLALLGNRLLGAAPANEDPRWLWLLLLALPVALLAARRGDRRAAARTIDRGLGSKDLFATLLHLRHAPGAYAPLVADQAARRASGCSPASLRPWHPGPGLRWLGGAALLLTLAWATLPVCDPFGERQAAAALAERQERLEATRTGLAARRELVEARRDELGEEHSAAVQERLDALLAQLHAARPETREANDTRLRDSGEALAELHAERQEQRLADELARRDQGQQLGDGGLRELAEAMRRGDAAPLRSALEELQQLREQLQGGDLAAPDAQRALRRLRRELEGLQDLARRELGDPALAEDLAKALEQVDLSRFDGMQQEALDALRESLDLAGLDAERLAQALRDLQALEQAMELAQRARAANREGQLGQGECEACQGKGLQAYAELYRELLAAGRADAPGQGQGNGQGQGQGNGQGMGGPGQGQGGNAPEDPDQATDFSIERLQGRLHAGRMLMEWETKGLGEAGEVQEAWRDTVETVRQDLSEAIIHEQVPAGYHEGVRAYFDALAGRPAVGGGGAGP